MAFNVSVHTVTPPIIRLELWDRSPLEEIEAHIDAIAQCVDANGWTAQPVYLIVDATRFGIQFNEAMQLLKTHTRRRGERGAASDPLLIGCLVGIQNGMLRLASQMLAKASTRRPMHVFETLDEAVHFITTNYQYETKTNIQATS